MVLASLMVLASGLALVPAPTSLRMTGEAGSLARTNFVDAAALEPEAYRLTVGPSGVSVASRDAAGRFYALQTLDQFPSDGTPSVVIEDRPAFRWRGLMIDEGRNFFGKGAVKRLIARMAEHKLNVLHWHLTEDQGWRLALDGFPELVEYGAVRPESPARECRGTEEDFIGDGMRYGPFFYSAADVREILAFAAARHVRIVPEIETPGHARALLAAHPEFSCRGAAALARVPRVQNNIEDDVICAGNAEAVEFCARVYEAVARLFPGEYVHLGGDECPKKRWQKCPKCQRKMNELGIRDERRLQGWFTMVMTERLRACGKRAVGWDEVMTSGAGTDTVVQCWRSEKVAATAVSNGYEIVLSPLQFTYYSMPQGVPDDPYHYWSPQARLSLEKAYSFDPLKFVPADGREKAIGAECCMWSERTFNEEDLNWKLFPRVSAFAEVVWTGAGRPGYADFKARMAVHRRRLVERHVNCAPLE